MKTIIRKITPSDTDTFAKWWRDKELISLTSGNFSEITDKEISDSVYAMANNPLHWMIEVDGKTVGHIDLEKISLSKAELQIVIGDKEYWGKGVAKDVLTQVLKKATELDLKNIYLEVRPTNLRAIAFYKKVGFKETGIKKYPDNPNMPEVIIMELELGLNRN